MKQLLFILGLMVAMPAMASNLEDVKILEVTPQKDAVKLKLHAVSGPEGSYFFVDVLKSDADAFDKLALVAKKLQAGDTFKLSLDIKSFSMSPSGSKYRSPYVKFSGSDAKK